jgi:hypothetical protein
VRSLLDQVQDLVGETSVGQRERFGIGCRHSWCLVEIDLTRIGSRVGCRYDGMEVRED